MTVSFKILCIFLNIFISFKWFVVCTCYVRRKMEKNNITGVNYLGETINFIIREYGIKNENNGS